jgi:retron-type reverse transcriptase
MYDSSDGGWAKSDPQKAHALADYFERVFQPHAPNHTGNVTQDTSLPQVPEPPASPTKKFTVTEVREAIRKLRHTKAPGYDLINGLTLKQLPDIGLSAIVYIYNDILRTGYFPGQWKVSQIIPIHKHGKPADDIKSYRPISLLPILSKVFEKLLIVRLQRILHLTQIIPDHQFGFRRKHSTIEQIHRITNTIQGALENKLYCNVVFLDISQAFDQVRHEGLLYKFHSLLPTNTCRIIKSYLTNRYFRTKYREAYSSLRPVLAGVPQGSVLGPLLYIIYTADLPTMVNSTTATFADDTAVVTVHEDPTQATHRHQKHLNKIQTWLHAWKMEVMKRNQHKSPSLSTRKRVLQSK